MRIHSSSTTPVKSPMASLQELPSLPSTLLGCLVGRLLDKAPALQTRVAHQGLVEFLSNSSSNNKLVCELLQPFRIDLQSQLASKTIMRRFARLPLSLCQNWRCMHASSKMQLRPLSCITPSCVCAPLRRRRCLSTLNDSSLESLVWC